MCVKHCTTGNQANHNHRNNNRYIEFQLDKTYSYQINIENQILVRFNQTENGQNGLVEENLIKVDCEAKLSPLNNCEILMTLDNIQIKFANAKPSQLEDEEIKKFVRQLQTPIIFSYKDGIVTEVCSPTSHNDHDYDEDPFVTNVKKSIISSLQTTPNIISEENNGKNLHVTKLNF